LSDIDNLIYCSEDTETLEDIRTYGCTFDLEGQKLSAVSDERSVQANLYKIVSSYDLKGAAQGQVGVNDKKGNRIDCVASTVGRLQVVEYGCSFEFADDIRLD